MGIKRIARFVYIMEVQNFCCSFAHLQLTYSPIRTKGIGLSDGEVMERLWSYLRRFSRMTKEMRPSHRVDILSSALLYYCQQTKLRLRIHAA